MRCTGGVTSSNQEPDLPPLYPVEHHEGGVVVRRAGVHVTRTAADTPEYVTELWVRAYDQGWSQGQRLGWEEGRRIPQQQMRAIISDASF